jgi:hypothetical protein
VTAAAVCVVSWGDGARRRDSPFALESLACVACLPPVEADCPSKDCQGVRQGSDAESDGAMRAGQ